MISKKDCPDRAVLFHQKPSIIKAGAPGILDGLENQALTTQSAIRTIRSGLRVAELSTFPSIVDIPEHKITESDVKTVIDIPDQEDFVRILNDTILDGEDDLDRVPDLTSLRFPLFSNVVTHMSDHVSSVAFR